MTIEEVLKIEISTADKYLRKAIFEAFEGYDYWRMVKINFEDMHIDHIIPKSKGGRDLITNYVPTHSRINLVKSGRLLDDDTLFSVKALVNKVYSYKVAELYIKYKYETKVNNFCDLDLLMLINSMLNNILIYCTECDSFSNFEVNCNSYKCNNCLTSNILHQGLGEISFVLSKNYSKLLSSHAIIDSSRLFESDDINQINLIKLKEALKFVSRKS